MPTIRKPQCASLKMKIQRGIIRSHVSCLESHGERLVAPPVRREDRAEEVGAVGPDQLASMVRQDVHHVPGVRSWPEGPGGGHGPVAVSNLAAGEGRGGRREPSGRGRLYGNMHHNSLGQCHLTGSYRLNGTLVEENGPVFYFCIWFFLGGSLFLQTRMVSGVHRVSAEDGGESAQSLSYLNRNNTLWWLCAISSTQDASTRGTSGVLCASLTSAKSDWGSKVSHRADVVLCRRSYLSDSFSGVVTVCHHHKLLQLSLWNQSVNPFIFNIRLYFLVNGSVCWQ